MQVKNIECQIAQAQLRRYLTGEEMPNAIVTDLETHLRHCPECMDSAQSLRESLKGVLHAKVTGKPIQEAQPRPAPKADPRPMAQTAVVQTPADLLDAPDEDFQPKKTPNKSNLKTLAYSGALALVLVLMSTVFQDPTRLFGPRASSVTPDTPPATTTDTDQSEPVQDEPVETSPTEAQTPVETPVETATDTDKPLETSGLIVADGATGTKTVKTDPPKQDPKPQPKTPAKKKGGKGGVGTIRVYPPDK